MTKALAHLEHFDGSGTSRDFLMTLIRLSGSSVVPEGVKVLTPHDMNADSAEWYEVEFQAEFLLADNWTSSMWHTWVRDQLRSEQIAGRIKLSCECPDFLEDRTGKEKVDYLFGWYEEADDD